MIGTYSLISDFSYGQTRALGRESKTVEEMRNVSRLHCLGSLFWLFTDPDARFLSLKNIWEADTFFCSNVTDIIMHPAYQQIIGMGKDALPYIFRELKASCGHWFWALSAITGEDPVDPDDVGDFEAMRDCWLNWARERRNEYLYRV